MPLPSSAEKGRYSTLFILMEHQRTDDVVGATTRLTSRIIYYSFE